MGTPSAMGIRWLNVNPWIIPIATSKYCTTRDPKTPEKYLTEYSIKYPIGYYINLIYIYKYNILYKMIFHNIPINCSHDCCNHVQSDRFSAQGHAAPLAARSSVTSDGFCDGKQPWGEGVYTVYIWIRTHHEAKRSK
jgi:hypothetical protein